MVTVFVYGTLRPQQGNHHLLAHAQHLGTATAEGLVLHDAGYFPYAARGNGRIVGDLYVVDPGTLARLDRLEGYRPHGTSHYLRKQWPITHGAVPTAALYLADPSVCLTRYPRIPSGDWTRK